MSTKSFAQMLKQARPFLFIILYQFGHAGMSIISKFALNQGISQSVLVVYRHIIGAIIIAPFALLLERKTRPKMTTSVFIKIMLLVFIEPVLDQNLYYTGMKYTTATFATAMCNVLPSFTLVLAWIFRLEEVNLLERRSQAKVFGTAVTIGGAMFMTMFNGPVLNLPWTSDNNSHHAKPLIVAANKKISAKGALMITAACACSSSFFILQAITLKSYPAELSLTAWICVVGVAQSSIAAVILERGKPSAWSLSSSSMLIASLYRDFPIGDFLLHSRSGHEGKGPVFATAFYPLGLVLVAILSSFILSETMYLGRVIGAVIIVFGLYMILWDKTKNNSPSQSIEEVSGKTDIVDDQHSNTRIESTKIEIQGLAAINVTQGKFREGVDTKKLISPIKDTTGPYR